MTNIEYLEQRVREKQKKLISVKQISQNLGGEIKSTNYYKFKMLERKDTADVIVSKFFLYKEELSEQNNYEDGKLFDDKELNSLFVMNQVLGINKDTPCSLTKKINHELGYYSFRETDFCKALLRENINVISHYLFNNCKVSRFDIVESCQNFENSDEHKKKIQFLASYLKDKKLTEREEIIEVLSKTIEISMRKNLFKKNKLNKYAKELTELMPVNFHSAFSNKDENEFFIYYKNYLTLFTFLINLI